MCCTVRSAQRLKGFSDVIPSRLVNIYLQGTESAGTLIAKLDRQDEGKVLRSISNYRGTDKSLSRPERKQATATEDFDVHISYL